MVRVLVRKSPGLKGKGGVYGLDAMTMSFDNADPELIRKRLRGRTAATIREYVRMGPDTG